MPVIVPPGMSLVTFQFSPISPLGSKPVFTFGMDASPTAAVASDLYTWWHGGYRSRQDSSTQLVSIRLWNNVAEHTELVGEAGTSVGAQAPPQITPVIQKRTGLSGRANRGRMYWPYVLGIGNVEENGTLGVTTVGDLQTIADNLLLVTATYGTGMQLFHNDVSDATPVTTLKVAPQSATQRRRNRR